MTEKQEIDNPKKLLSWNFLSGLAKGLGFAFGMSFVFALILWILSKLTLIPFFGNLVVSILEYVQKTKAY